MRSLENLRARFDGIYDQFIVGGGFVESDDYYRIEKERYWRSLELFCSLNLPSPCNILEVGGGQLALLCHKLFGDHCTVGDVSDSYSEPLRGHGIKSVTFNLIDPQVNTVAQKFDAVVLLEVIEHLPVPAYVVFEHIKHVLAPNGLIFLTTPNLFRLRNVIRMVLGRPFLDHFMLPQPGFGLGHQLEYSAEHLGWQLKQAGLQVLMLDHDNRGSTGHSPVARLARQLAAPLERFRPILRDGLVAAARVSTEQNTR